MTSGQSSRRADLTSLMECMFGAHARVPLNLAALQCLALVRKRCCETD